MKLTEKQAAEIVKQRPELADLLKPARGNKYGAVKAEYNGVLYDSTLESKVAAQLDQYKMLGKVTRWERQVPYALAGGIEYRADFEVWYSAGLYRVLDAKGVIPAAFRLKARLFLEAFGFRIDIVKHWRDTPQEGRL